MWYDMKAIGICLCTEYDIYLQWIYNCIDIESHTIQALPLNCRHKNCAPPISWLNTIAKWDYVVKIQYRLSGNGRMKMEITYKIENDYSKKNLELGAEPCRRFRGWHCSWLRGRLRSGHSSGRPHRCRDRCHRRHASGHVVYIGGGECCFLLQNIFFRGDKRTLRLYTSKRIKFV